MIFYRVAIDQTYRQERMTWTENVLTLERASCIVKRFDESDGVAENDTERIIHSISITREYLRDDK